MKTNNIVTIFCQEDGHKFCIGKSIGSKSDPVTFICNCKCHVWNEGQNKEKTPKEYLETLKSQEYRNWVHR